MKRLLHYALIAIILTMGLIPARANQELLKNNVFYLMTMNMLANDEDVGGNIMSKTDRIKIINLGPNVNSKDLDYAPTISADGKTLYFVSNRPGSILSNTGVLTHDFWACTKPFRKDTVFTPPYNIDYSDEPKYFNVNSVEHEGVASIASDKQSIFITCNNRPDGLGVTDIYMSTLKGDKWTKPYNLGKNVNSETWDSQPSIAPDKSRLYFVSTRKGPNSRDGKPDLKNADLWYCDWNEEDEEWGVAKNLEAINTSGIEFSPFIAADGITLFFASNGHKPRVGGLDFYVTRYDKTTDSWSKPELMPEPINTKDDEMFITLPAAGDILYFSSKRTDIKGFQGDLDVYMAFIPTFFKAVNLTGTVVDECSQEFIPAEITIKNLVTNRVVKDSVTISKNQFLVTISNSDYGNPKDSLKFVDLEITAKNDKYGQTTIVQRVEKPTITDNPTEDGAIADEIKVRLQLGEVPVLTAEIAEASYIARNKKKTPALANFRGLVMEETITWEIYPLLNYVFFEIGDSKIPARYKLLKDKKQTIQFTDTTIAGGTLDKYYHVLNIYGYRLNKFPTDKIKIIGCTDDANPEEKNVELSKQRALNVKEYLKNMWGITEDRMTVTWQKKPSSPSGYEQDPLLGQAENRRVEILCDNWEVIKPVFFKGSVIAPQPITMNWITKNGIEDKIISKRRIDIKRGEKIWKTLTQDEISMKDGKFEWDWQDDNLEYPTDEIPFTAQFIVTSTKGNECKSNIVEIPVMQISSARKRVETEGDSTKENYNLILFPFNSANAGPLNERIMNDYVYSRCRGTSVIKVEGHTDVKGMENTNLKLSDNRAGSVRAGINKKTGGKYGLLNSIGVGEEKPLYRNDVPEGRFYNRTVRVEIRTPLKEFDNE